MIITKNVSKQFDDIKAVDDISLEIKEGSVFGMIGTNGAGKSTFIRMLAGVYKPDEGEITIDDMNVYENPEDKKLFFYISDDQYFEPRYTPNDLIEYYASFYENFDIEKCRMLLEKFGLAPKRRIRTFSKGMKKQLSVICAVCAGTKYIYCDETFDGLDPVMRQAVKSLFAQEIEDRGLTPVIASHNLRELEDICDHVGLLHRGGVLLSKDLETMKLQIHKIQCAFNNEEAEREFLDKLDIVTKEQRGSLKILVVRGDEDDIREMTENSGAIFAEMLPLTLEEIFINETEVAGYDIKKLIF